MKWKFLLPLTYFAFSQICFATLPLGSKPQEIVLDGDSGGKVNKGGAWKSSDLVGKVHVLFYVDPNQKDLNKEASEAIKKEGFASEKMTSVAIINMEASRIPNFLLSYKIKKSQEEYPRTIYVEDKTRLLVQKWGLQDKSSDIVVFDKEGKVVFSVDGKLDSDQIVKLISIIKANI